MLRFATLAVLVGIALPALCPASARAQESHLEAYRAYWESGVNPGDPEASEHFSARSLAQLEELKAEDPGMIEDMLVFMADRTRALHEAAALGEIRVVEQDKESATLEVRFEGKTGPLSPDLPHRAIVKMALEEGRWKVVKESYQVGPGSSAERPPAGSAAEEISCPAGTVLGEPAAPNELRLHDASGERTVRFREALALREEDRLTVKLPSFGGNELVVETEHGGQGPGAYGATLGGWWGAGGCPAIPASVVASEGAGGELEWAPGKGSGSFRATFSLRDTDAGEPALSGTIERGTLVDISPAPVSGDSRMAKTDGELIVPDWASVRHHPAQELLEVHLGYSHDRGTGGSSVHVEGFRGESGVLVGEERFGKVQVTVIHEFDGRRIRMEAREVNPSDLPGGEITAEQALRLGTLAARVTMDRVVTIPELRPMEN